MRTIWKLPTDTVWPRLREPGIIIFTLLLDVQNNNKHHDWNSCGVYETNICMGTFISKVFQQCTWVRRSCSLCHLMPTLSSNSSMKFKSFLAGNSLDYLLTLADKRHGGGVTVVQTVVWTVVRLPYFCFFKLRAHQLDGRWPSCFLWACFLWPR